MLKLILGRAGTGKSTLILNRMAEGVKSRGQVLIVPEQHSHDAERRLCGVAGNSVSLGAEVLSFTRLASRLFSVAGGLAEPTLDPGGRLRLMAVARRSVAEGVTGVQTCALPICRGAEGVRPPLPEAPVFVPVGGYGGRVQGGRHLPGEAVGGFGVHWGGDGGQAL